MIIITGIGRSGTSFTASVLNKAGARFKGDWFSEDLKAGMEYGKVAELNNMLLKGSASTLDEAISKFGVPEIKMELSDGVMVKDPRFTMTLDHWLKGGFKIEHIVYCARDYREIFDSSLKSGCGMGGDQVIGLNIPTFDGFKVFFSYVERTFFRTAEKAGIPLTTIVFPKSVNDFTEIEKLSSLVDKDRLKSAWENLRKPDMVGSKTEKLPETDDKQNLMAAYAKLNLKLNSDLRKMEEKLKQKTAELEAEQARWPNRIDRVFRKKFVYPIRDFFKGNEKQQT